eukprot:9034703-Karenia_brevis.AAC.1
MSDTYSKSIEDDDSPPCLRGSYKDAGPSPARPDTSLVRTGRPGGVTGAADPDGCPGGVGGCSELYGD